MLHKFLTSNNFMGGGCNLLPDSDIVIWGAGGTDALCYSMLEKNGIANKVIGVVDTREDKHGMTSYGHMVYSLAFLEKEPNAIIIIASASYHEIYPMIQNKDAKDIFVYTYIVSNPHLTEKVKILDYDELFFEYQRDPLTTASIEILQFLRRNNSEIIVPYEVAATFSAFYDYWDSDELSLSVYDKLTFVDAGAFAGETISLWHNSYSDKINKIYAFEPDGRIYAILRENVNEWGLSEKVVLHNCGLFDKRQVLRFSSGGGGSSHISEIGDETISVMPLDEIDIKVEGKLCIKMDIEGVELEALIGAKETIKKYSPELAICVYHKFDDVLTIPKYIKSVNPAYNCILRGGAHMECYASVDRFG